MLLLTLQHLLFISSKLKIGFLQMRVSDMSRQMADVRKQMENDDQLKSLMAGLRGSNIDDSDFADANVVMRLVEVDRDEQDQLPQVAPLLLALAAICSIRLFQVALTSSIDLLEDLARA